MIGKKLNTKLESLKTQVKTQKNRISEEFSELSDEIKGKRMELSEELSEKKQQLKEELKSNQLKMIARFRRKQKAKTATIGTWHLAFGIWHAAYMAPRREVVGEAMMWAHHDSRWRSARYVVLASR